MFVSQDDRALAVSRLVAGNVNRLGQINPEVEPYRSEAERQGITFVDLTKLKTGDSLNHGKFAESPQIVRAIGTRLIAGQTLTQSEVGLGDNITILAAGTARAIGSGVGLAVSTPISIVDPNTRRNLAGQSDSLAGQVGVGPAAAGGKDALAEELLSGPGNSDDGR